MTIQIARFLKRLFKTLYLVGPKLAVRIIDPF
jgi:hypothetical protein